LTFHFTGGCLAKNLIRPKIIEESTPIGHIRLGIGTQKCVKRGNCGIELISGGPSKLILAIFDPADLQEFLPNYSQQIGLLE
jgi:hypothetical protein